MTHRTRSNEHDNAWQTRRQLSDLLRAMLQRTPIPQIDDWPQLIAFAADEQLTPTFAALPYWEKRAEHIPKDVRQYFEAALFLNRERESRMADALVRAMTILQPMEPVALKGAANLIGRLYPQPGARLMGDLDILVCDGKGASDLLRQAGFEPPEEDSKAWIGVRHHHEPMQVDRSTGTGIELHHRLCAIGDPIILRADAVRNGSVMQNFEGLGVRIPSPTDRLVHSIAHDQVSDRGALSRRISIRVILEVTMLAKSEPIDWDAAENAFPKGRWRQAFVRVLALASSWLDAPVPTRFSSEAEAAISWLCRPQSKSAQAALIAAHRTAALLRTQPVALLNLFDPFWTRQRISQLFR